MRAIKFRAWDFDKNKMFYGYELDKPNMIDFNGNVCETGNTGKMCEYGCTAEYINKAENCVLMQFTGLLDETGKEVFEGDIVLYNDTMIGEVYYDEAETSYVIKPLNEESSYEILGLAAPLRIIGNIFENQIYADSCEGW